MCSTTKWMRFQSPGSGLRPLGMATLRSLQDASPSYWDLVWVRRRRYPRAGGVSAIASDPGRRGAVQPAAGQPARRFITWPALAMMTVGSVGYLGSAPATAVLGLASVFLYVLRVPGARVTGRGRTRLRVARRRL